MTVTELIPHALTVDEVKDVLDYTENLQEKLFSLDLDSPAGFVFDSSSEDLIDEPRDTFQPHPALSFKIGSRQFEMTDVAVDQAVRLVGLTSAYASKTPLSLIVPHLEYWFKNKGGEYKALLKDDVVISFCRPGTVVYSSSDLLDAILKSRDMRPEEVSILNFHHDIFETHFSLVDHTVVKEVKDYDNILGGIQFQNSLTGLKPLILSLYAHRELERAGSISTAVVPMVWQRRNDKTYLEADESTRESLQTVESFVEQSSPVLLSQFNYEVDRLKVLAKKQLDEHVGDFLRDIVKQFKIPPRLYNPIIESYAENARDHTMLDLWTAFGRVACEDQELSPRLRRLMLQAAGELAGHPSMCESCHRVKI